MSDETINEESILGNPIHLPKLNGTSYEKFPSTELREKEDLPMVIFLPNYSNKSKEC